MPRVRPTRNPELAAEIARQGRFKVDLAAEIGCHPNTITGVINGAFNPTPELRARLADALGRPEHELFAEVPA